MLPNRVSNPGPLTYESGATRIDAEDRSTRTQRFGHTFLVIIVSLYALREIKNYHDHAEFQTQSLG